MAAQLPPGFVYLADVAPSIQQEIRYAGSNNFTGQKVPGYKAGKCILTEKAAQALAKAQAELLRSRYSLKVYDCYRPKTAVQAFKEWSEDKKLKRMKTAFFPNEKKTELFKEGYIAEYSSHSRGSTVDITIVPAQSSPQLPPAEAALKSCVADDVERMLDTSIDMGTGFDCMDIRSHYYSRRVPIVAQNHRKILRDIMHKYGFKPYNKEWWHFTLHREPYPRKYFDFSIT